MLDYAREDQVATGASPSRLWLPILVATVFAGSATALLFHYQLFALQLLGAMVGLETPVGGAAVVAAGTAVFVTVFGLLVSRPGVAPAVATGWRLGFVGLVYGSLLFVSAFAIALPLLTQATPVRPLPLPYLPVDAFLVHLVFGLLVGGTFAWLWRPTAGQ
jgi:hypothetical protein